MMWFYHKKENFIKDFHDEINKLTFLDEKDTNVMLTWNSKKSKKAGTSKGCDRNVFLLLIFWSNFLIHFLCVWFQPFTANVTQCCVEHNVSQGCLDICSLGLDLDVLRNKPTCESEFDKLMKCASGKNKKSSWLTLSSEVCRQNFIHMQ